MVKYGLIDCPDMCGGKALPKSGGILYRTTIAEFGVFARTLAQKSDPLFRWSCANRA